jgi:hypothetical protein
VGALADYEIIHNSTADSTLVILVRVKVNLSQEYLIIKRDIAMECPH